MKAWAQGRGPNMTENRDRDGAKIGDAERKKCQGLPPRLFSGC